jgi:hypothetical protein
VKVKGREKREKRKERNKGKKWERKLVIKQQTRLPNP